MPAITIVGTSDAALFRVTLDSRRVTLNKGEAIVDITADADHALQWFVRGDEGDKYSIGITDPSDAKFKHSATLDDEGKDAGLHWVKVQA